MTKIILIRHGQTNWNLTGKYQGHADVELTNKGIEQAKQAAERLYNEKIVAVYSSDLSRAAKTASCIAYDRNLVVTTLPELREISFGDWEGLTFDQIKERWPEEFAKMFSRPDIVKIPNGETVPMVANRIVKTICKLADTHNDKTIAVVSHGMAIRCALAHFLHVPLQYVWNIRQDNTAVNMLTYYAHDHAIIDLLNDTHHLR